LNFQDTLGEKLEERKGLVQQEMDKLKAQIGDMEKEMKVEMGISEAKKA
jgi:hypothetical protein